MKAACHIIALTSRRLESFREWRADLESRLREGELSPSLESHLSKYRKTIPALALINHVADGGGGQVGEAAVLRALAFAEYLESHAQRAYSAGGQSEASAAKAILTRIRKGRPHGRLYTARRHAGALGKPDRPRPSEGRPRLLCDLDWLAAKTEQTGGRPRTSYSINPGALA